MLMQNSAEQIKVVPVAYIAAIASVATLLYSICRDWLASKRARREARDQRLQISLRDFLRPLLTRLGRIEGLFQVFLKGKPPAFEALSYLIDPGGYRVEGWSGPLSDSDTAILREIVGEVGEIERLILERGSLCNDPTLTRIELETGSPADTSALSPLQSSSALFGCIRLAHLGHIQTPFASDMQFVFPRKLRSLVEQAVKNAEKSLDA